MPQHFYARNQHLMKQAHAVYSSALRSGKLTKPTACTLCGLKLKIVGHHEDYEKPLDVLWVCTTCHGLLHRGFSPNEVQQKAQGQSESERCRIAIMFAADSLGKFSAYDVARILGLKRPNVAVYEALWDLNLDRERIEWGNSYRTVYMRSRIFFSNGKVYKRTSK